MPAPGKSIAALLLSLLLTPVLSQAASPQIDSMHYPAWLVRNYETLPLAPGTRLESNDLIRTGEGSRVQLRLDDGSRIRLGESVRFLIRRLPESTTAAAASSLPSFHVQRGVFHVVTAAGSRLEFELGDVSATLNSADAWGRVDLKKDALCLVEGEIDIDSPPDGVTMDQALSCYVKPRDLPALPVDSIELRQHRLWLAETELKPQAGIVVANGEWQLVLISLTDGRRAETVLAEFRQRGFAARRKSVVRQGRTLHRLLLPGFESIEAALSARTRVERDLGIRDAWVWKKPD